MSKKKILFICTHNSARSQLAQALMNFYHGEFWEAYSAGTIKTFVKPEVLQVLGQLNIPHHSLYSKTIDEAKQFGPFNISVTLCDSAKESCPIFTGQGIKLHHEFPDPSEAHEAGKIRAFQNTRDSIKSWLDKLTEEYK